jgi:hypothetical protein
MIALKRINTVLNGIYALEIKDWRLAIGLISAALPRKQGGVKSHLLRKTSSPICKDQS